MTNPALILISHGTSSPAGQFAVRTFVDQVAAKAKVRGVGNVYRGHIDVEQPNVENALTEIPIGATAIIVPLLLSAGYHVNHDLSMARDSAIAGGRAVTVAKPLGPDERIIALLWRRAIEAKVQIDDAIVLAAAGSSDPHATQQCRQAAEMLAARIEKEVRIGFLSAATPPLSEAIAQARVVNPRQRVAVLSYLLAPGYFHDRATAAGADLVTQPLLSPNLAVDDSLVELVLDRYFAAP